MNILGIIDKKRWNEELTYEELDYAFNGYLKKEIPDYQMSALLMAICINELSEQEIFDLTDIFLKSGDVLDLSLVDGILVDKHSTGGVGDKTTLVVGPIVAACGLKMAKMSGRGLGLTGGTIDKLESIPGFRVSLSEEEFINQLNEVGYVNVSQNDKLVPMDKVIYTLRDASATAQSIGLIAVSIMSKKIASSVPNILIDVKYGKGALLRTKEDAQKFSDIVIKIGKKYNRNVKTYIDNMNIPLGNNIGNSLEIVEVMDILQGKEGYLTNICLKLAAILISMGKHISEKEALEEAKIALRSGKAFQKFLDFVFAQGGDITKLEVCDDIIEIKSEKEGYLKTIDAHKVAQLASSIGCFRHSKEEKIDYKVGIVLNNDLNSYIHIGDPLCHLYVNDKNIDVKQMALDCFTIEGE